MSQNSDKSMKELLKELIHDDEEEFTKLVPKVKQIVKVKTDGSPILVCDSSNLNQKEQIICYLIGKFYSKLLELSPIDSATIDEISTGLRLDSNVVSARMSNLRDAHLVDQVTRGEYKVSTVFLNETLDKIINKIGDKNV